ncbi:hypothetical protein ACFLY0_01925 [Patescibacteria group bacterium]
MNIPIDQDPSIPEIDVLECLSDEELARLLLRQLWQCYDSGGISIGRSPESQLLEAVMNIIPLPDLVDMDRFYSDDIMIEARIRFAVIERESCEMKQYALFQQNPTLSDNCLAYLLLKKLTNLYEKEEFPRLAEVGLITSAMKLISIDLIENLESLPDFSGKVLLQEAADRDWAKNH